MKDALRGWFCERCGENGACFESEMKRAEVAHMRECPGDYDPDQRFLVETNTN